MKRTLTIVAASLALALSSVSCLKESDVLFSSTIMGNLEDNTIIGDDGSRFIVTNMDAYPGLDTLKRVVAAVQAKKKISDNEYEGVISGFANVLVKDYEKASTMDAEKIGKDAICLDALWVEGSYISTRFQITAIVDSKVKHLVNLVCNDVKSNADTIYFELRHNAYGESYEYTSSIDDNPAAKKDSYYVQTGYASFPFAEGLFKDGQVMRVDFDWLAPTPDGYLMPIKKHYTYTGKYKKNTK